jgi:hypothetical protein
VLSETDHPAVGLLRAIFADGVFATVPDGAPVFHALPRLSSDEVDDLLRLVCARVLAHLVRRGIIERVDSRREIADSRRVPALLG